MAKEIKSHEELRVAVASLNAEVLALCNAKAEDELTRVFIEAKDNLIAVFNCNKDRIQDSKKSNTLKK